MFITNFDFLNIVLKCTDFGYGVFCHPLYPASLEGASAESPPAGYAFSCDFTQGSKLWCTWSLFFFYSSSRSFTASVKRPLWIRDVCQSDPQGSGLSSTTLSVWGSHLHVGRRLFHLVCWWHEEGVYPESSGGLACLKEQSGSCRHWLAKVFLSSFHPEICFLFTRCPAIYSEEIENWRRSHAPDRNMKDQKMWAIDGAWPWFHHPNFLFHFFFQGERGMLLDQALQTTACVANLAISYFCMVLELRINLKKRKEKEE